MAPCWELSTLSTALVGSTPGFQPDIVPSSVANRKIAGLPAFSLKSLVKLKTVPVGADGGGPFIGGGIVTTSGMIAPVLSYRVERPVPLSDTHQGEPELRDSPHALTRLGSTVAVDETELESVTRSVCW